MLTVLPRTLDVTVDNGPRALDITVNNGPRALGVTVDNGSILRVVHKDRQNSEL